MKIVVWIVPVILFVTGLISKYKPAKTINSVVGYRSAKSRSSQANWDKAQQLMAHYMIIIGLIEAAATLIAMIVLNGLPEQQALIFILIFVLVQACGAILVIPLVESKLG